MNKNSFAYQVLMDIVGLSKEACIGLQNPRAWLYLGPDAESDLCKEDWRKRHRALKYLERTGVLEAQKTAKQYKVRLSKFGAEQAIEGLLSNSAYLPGQKHCLVAFDIPETHRKLRRSIRIALKDLDFKPLQKSVWITRKDNARYLRKLFRLRKQQKWVKVFIVDSVVI